MQGLTRALLHQPPVLILLGIVLVFGLSAGDLFLSGQNLANVARQVSIEAPVVFGQMIVLIAGGIDISVGSTMAMSAALAVGLQGYGTLTAVAAALLFGVFVGAVNGFLVTRCRIVPFVATLGTMSVVRGILLTYTRQESIVSQDPGFAWWGGGSLGFMPVPMLVAIVLAAVLTLLLQKTRTGRNLYAVGGNKEAAYLAAISVDRYLFLAFVISGFMAGISGVLLASRLESASVQLGTETPLLAIAAAMIGGASLLGGRGTVVGAFLGVLALGLLTNGMNLLGVHTYYQIAIRAMILIAVVAVDAFTTNLMRRRLTAAGVARTGTGA
jgi:ribose transport system permease protein